MKKILLIIISLLFSTYSFSKTSIHAGSSISIYSVDTPSDVSNSVFSVELKTLFEINEYVSVGGYLSYTEFKDINIGFAEYDSTGFPLYALIRFNFLVHPQFSLYGAAGAGLCMLVIDSPTEQKNVTSLGMLISAGIEFKLLFENFVYLEIQMHDSFEKSISPVWFLTTGIGFAF